MESDKILTIATWSRQPGRVSLSSLLLGNTLILAVAALAGARGSPRSYVQLLCEHLRLENLEYHFFARNAVNIRLVNQSKDSSATGSGWIFLRAGYQSLIFKAQNALDLLRENQRGPMRMQRSTVQKKPDLCTPVNA
jgi:hypothetical protein